MANIKNKPLPIRQTISQLEEAFGQWENFSNESTVKKETSSNKNLLEKTRMLLNELKKQIEEFSEPKPLRPKQNKPL